MHNPGEQEFRHYNETLRPDEVIFPEVGQASERRYGVTVHRPAWQWEIVAVEAGRTRHVAFVSTLYGLDQVLGLARGLHRGCMPACN